MEYGQSLITQAVLVLLLSCLYLGYTDYTEYRLPNKITVPLIVAGLTYHLYMGGFNSALLGMLVAGGVFLIGALKGGIGGGDVKFSAAIGAWLGFPDGPWVIAAGAVLATIYGLFKDPKAKAWVKLTLTMLVLKLAGSKVSVPSRSIDLPENDSCKIPYGAFLAVSVYGYYVITMPYLRSVIVAIMIASAILMLAESLQQKLKISGKTSL